MAHQAETILAAIVTILKAGGTDAGARVYRGRTLPVDSPEGVASPSPRDIGAVVH